jgi:hypothetical protein
VGERVRVYVSESLPALVADGAFPPGAYEAVLSADPDDDGDRVFKALSLTPVGSRVSAYSPTRQAQPYSIAITDSALAWTMLDAPIDLLKADHGPIPPDARWITVHPNGPESKGQPVLVVPAGEGGAMRVIGGAGGKLNMLKLRGVKSEGEYKASAAANQAEARKKRKDQIASDKALGLHEARRKRARSCSSKRARRGSRLFRPWFPHGAGTPMRSP